MTRFSVEGEGDGDGDRDRDGDEDEIEEGLSNDRRLPKKPRISSDPMAIAPKRASTSTSKTTAPASTSSAPQIPWVRESPLEERNIPVYLRNLESDEDEDYHLRLPFGGSYSGEELEDGDEDDEEEEMEQQIVGSGGGGVIPTESPDDMPPYLEERGGGSLAAAPLSVTLTDPDVLDCAICFEPLNPPIYQCENGHTACASCCTNMKNKCASCSWPIGYNRCRAIEKVLESIRIPCPNIQHGCMESLSYGRKLHHETTCNFSPISCPHPNCFYIALPKLVYSHFVSQHSNSSKHFFCNSALSISLDNNQKHAFLCEKSEGIVFVLNRSIEPCGSLVDVVCIVPTSSGIRFFYEASASDGVSSIVLKTAVGKTTCWAGQAPDKKYLLVPNDFMSSGGQLKLGLTIRRTTS